MGQEHGAPHMLGAWAEWMPLALVRWVAKHGRLLRLRMPGTTLRFAVARPGVLVKVGEEATHEPR